MLLRLTDLAKDSKISTWTWARWIKAGKLPSVKLGRRRRVRAADYQKFLRAGRGK